MYKKIKTKILNYSRYIFELNSKNYLKQKFELWDELNNYLDRTSSTGCNYTDYAEIHKHVIKYKPKEILECGTGVSTIVLAHALKENNKGGRITSLESEYKYLEQAQKLLPSKLSQYVEMIYSPVVEDSFSLFRGCRYRDIPSRKYDFIFVDGPSYVAPSDGTIAFDIDCLNIIKESIDPVYAIIDKRVSTCYVLQKVLGKEKVKYNPYKHLGYVGPCTKNDVKHFSATKPSEAFNDSFKLMGKSLLKLK